MKKTNKKLTFWDILYWTLAVVPFLISLSFYSRLPDQVPTHWGADNMVNGYSSRNMAAFGIPSFMFFMAVLVNVIHRIDPKRENISRSKELKQITRWFVVVLAVLVQVIIILSGVGISFNVGTVISVPIAFLFVAIGNYLPKCRQNYSMGIKLPWTLADEDNWNRTHRLAGYVWTAGGILMMILGFFHLSDLYFTIFLAMVLIPSEKQRFMIEYMESLKYNNKITIPKEDIMAVSNVYYTNMRTTLQENLLQKLERLVKKAGMMDIDFNNKYTAIKIHFGEPGNLAYLRPNYSKVLVDLIKAQNGRVFLTDCNTLYVGRRKNALDHLDAAYENGYNPFTTGCHMIIADGLKGTDDVLVPIDGEYVKEAKIGRAIMDADIVISLSHFKGHEATGFGGALKNLGMGCGSRAGKMEMHNAGKPYVHTDMCVGCGSCQKNCAHGAITITDRKASIDVKKCVGCGRCIGACPVDAVDTLGDEANDILNCKIAEYSLAVLKDRPNFHVSLVVDVSPYCDCHAENDAPIVPNVGMFASFDPVALDVACADAVNRQPVLPGSLLSEKEHCHHDHFTDTHPDTNWKSCIDHAVKLGLGSKEYNLITI